VREERKGGWEKGMGWGEKGNNGKGGGKEEAAKRRVSLAVLTNPTPTRRRFVFTYMPSVGAQYRTVYVV
jgi:hypothetical protein